MSFWLILKSYDCFRNNERQEEDLSPSDDSEFSMADEPLVEYQVWL